MACPQCLGNSTLYNGNIAPFTVGPMSLRGFLFYQGEANADVNQTYGYYDCALKSLISSWRLKFGVPTAFFGVVMLAAFTHDSTFDPAFIAPLRDTQLASLSLPNVSLVAATDLGDPGTAAGPGGKSKLGSVHPRHKRPVGERLAAAVLDICFGHSAAAKDYLSPRYLSAHHVLSQHFTTTEVRLSVEIEFQLLPPDTMPLRVLAPGEATAADPHGLSSKCPIGVGVPASACAGFELKTNDNVWHSASATVVGGNKLVLTTVVNKTGAAIPRASRFGFGPWPVNTIVTAGDIPIYPWSEQPVQ